MEEVAFLKEKKGVKNQGEIDEFESAVLKVAEEFSKRGEHIKELEETLTKREEGIIKTVDMKSNADEFESTILGVAEEIKKRDILIREIKGALAMRNEQMKTLGKITELEMGDIEGVDAWIKELRSTITRPREVKDEVEVGRTDAIPLITKSEGEAKKGKVLGWLSSEKSEQAEKRDVRMKTLAAIKEEVLRGTSMEKSSSDDGKEEIKKAKRIATEEWVAKGEEEKSQAVQGEIKAMGARISKLEALLIKRDKQLKRFEELLQKNIEKAEANVQATSSVEEISQPEAKEKAATSKPSIEEHDTNPYDTILNFFKKHGELTVQEVEKESGINHTKVYYTLRKLDEDGRIFEIKKGKYRYIGE